MSDRPADDRTGSVDADADGSGTHEVLDKLEALLGRLHGTDAPPDEADTQAAIPTLTDPVCWVSPEPAIDPLPLRGQIPTLTEPVELLSSPDHAMPVTPDIDTRAPVEPGHHDAMPPPAVQPPVPPAGAGATLPSAEQLRERVNALLDPSLEQRLTERTLSDLDRTLIDLQHDFQQDLATWRQEQAERIREQVHGEIERAIDEVVDALVRQQDATSN